MPYTLYNNKQTNEIFFCTWCTQQQPFLDWRTFYDAEKKTGKKNVHIRDRAGIIYSVKCHIL